MIIILIIWLGQFFILKTAGHFASKIIVLKNRSWFSELMLGYCALSAFSVIVSLFFPINAWMFGILATICFPFSIYILYHENLLSFRPRLSFILILIPVLILTVPLPNHGDSAFYHAQALQWVEKFSVVPGLANFFGRLAFNSSFFTTEALFSLSPVSDISSRFLNGFLILIWFLFLYQNANDKSASFSARFTAVLFAISSLLISRGWVSTIAPDVTTGLFMLIISYHLVMAYLDTEDVAPLYLVVLSITALTIKLPSALLIPVLFFYPGIFQKTEWNKLWIPMLIMFPWLIRNIVLSGYLVYPYLPLWVWKPDWLVPADLAFIERAWISSWARIPAEPWQYVLSLPFTDWFPHWFDGQYVMNKIIVIVFCLAFLLAIYQFIFSILNKRKITTLQILKFTWCLAIIIWFVTAPDFRFGYGLVMPFLILMGLHLLKGHNIEVPILIPLFKTGFLALLFALAFYVIRKEKTELQRFIWIPEAYPTILMQQQMIGNQTIMVAPGEESCWNCPVPCINDDLFPYQIEMRGKSLKDGFRSVKNNHNKR